MQKLTVITPCYRVGNISKMVESVLLGRLYFDLTWLIVYDVDKIMQDYENEFPYHMLEQKVSTPIFHKGFSVSGNGPRNMGIDISEDNSWLYFLDDDNIAHSDFFKTIYYHINLDSTKMAYTFDQLMPNGSVRKSTLKTIKETHIDQAQYVIHKSFLGDLRFTQKYTADGELIEILYKQNPRVFKVINQVLCYYNKLR
jgi:hypothetical protein